jgi:hypothetical protein
VSRKITRAKKNNRAVRHVLGANVRDAHRIVYECEGRCHRVGGPSVIYLLGGEGWDIGGVAHREDGPAWIGEDGTEIWYRDGNIHREDGPAVIDSGGLKEYWLFGKWYEYRDWLIKVQEIQGTSSGQ